MKRAQLDVVTLVVGLALALALVACGGSRGSDGPDGGSEDGGGDSGGCLAVYEEIVRVEPGAVFAVRVEADGVLVPDPQPDPESELAGSADTAAAAEAVAAAPAWIRTRLARTLWSLSAADAEVLAAEILAADGATVDEVAWAIAVTHPAVLEWILGYGVEGLFLENAEGIYAVDGQLAYASLVELPEGRTTVALQGEAGAFQLEPEMYYWYVVYPRAYLELPAIVDGHFWRTLFSEDTTHGSTVVDAVAGAQTVQEAADGVGTWIQSFMEFGYGTNDLYPVDVYYAQFGSCGQYSILTTAAARTVMIPTLSVSARADDHEWNELWDGRWIMWDNSLGEIGSNPHYPYIDMPEIMDDDMQGGSGVFGEVAHVLRFRPDGYVWPSELYTTYQPIELTMRDGDGAPLEGAWIVATSAESGYLTCAWEYTDASGLATLQLGDDLLYDLGIYHAILGAHSVHAEIQTDSSGVAQTISVSHDDAFDRRFEPGGTLPPGGVELAYSFTVRETEQHRVNLLTEGYELGDTYAVLLPSGRIDAFVVDESACASLRAGENFRGYGQTLAQPSGEAAVPLPAGQPACVVLDNRWWPQSVKQVHFRVALGCPP